MNSLEATAQRLLQNDASNPHSSKKPEGVVRPGLGLSKSTIGPSKPSLREAMLAKKKEKEALAARNLPVRPGSAMAHFSPVRTVSNSSTVSTLSTATAGRSRPESTLAVGAGGLSVAPMRPAKRRPEMQPRPATAGPYSVRTHDQPSIERHSPPGNLRSKTVVTPKSMAASPKRTAPRTRPGHVATASDSSLPTPSRVSTIPKAAASPRGTPVKTKVAPRVVEATSPSKVHEDSPLAAPSPLETSQQQKENAAPQETLTEELVEPTVSDTPRSLRVYEDPFTEEQTTPRPVPIGPVLEDKPVNEGAANMGRSVEETDGTPAGAVFSPDKTKQNTRLLDSGITKVKAKSLDVHGFRKLQGILRDNKVPFNDEKFDALLLGLFEFLESPLTNFATDKVQDVKAQILATIKLLLKRARENFQPHVSRGLESLLATRSSYDARTHIVSGLELLADELVTLGDASEIALVLTRMLQSMDVDAHGSRSLSMGLHVLKEMIETRTSFHPADSELAQLAGLAGRCLESTESGVRMDAVQLCVALHARVGDTRFWDVMRGIKDDPKSVITYYIVKRQREAGIAAAAAAATAAAA